MVPNTVVIPPEIDIDYESLVTEDNEPLDSVYQERQQRLLTEVLYASWPTDDPTHPWWAAANVGVFYSRRVPAIVPDCFVAIGVAGPEDITVKEGHSYYVWDQGKPPDVVVEFVSKSPGGEDTDKLATYSKFGVPYYVIFDPNHRLSTESLRVFARSGASLVPTEVHRFPSFNLGVTIWTGEYDGFHADWLRWTDGQGALLPTKQEKLDAAESARLSEADRADAERERANEERERADLQSKRADQVARQRDELQSEVARLQEMLRQAGVDPAAR